MTERSGEDPAIEQVREQISRRGFLKLGLVGTALAATGGVGLALRGGALRDAPANLKVFSQHEYSVLAALGDLICPAMPPDLPGATALDVASKADAMFAPMPADIQKQFKMMLSLFDNALVGFLFEGRITPFTKLSPEDQYKSFESWGNSTIGFRNTVFNALRALVPALYYGDERTWKGVGYPGPPEIADILEYRRGKLEQEQRDAIAASTPEAIAASNPPMRSGEAD